MNLKLLSRTIKIMELTRFNIDDIFLFDYNELPKEVIEKYICVSE